MSVKEIDEIKEQFKKVISYSQGIENPVVDDLFEKWLEGKRDFIEAMGGKLIYEFPKNVFFELNKHDKEIKVDDFANLVEQNYSNPGLADFISSQREGFFTNRVINSIVTDNGDKIPKDMKLLKAFKFFESNKEALEALQAAASMIIQEDKVEGTLCLSVHPLDFLSASENNHNWRSCHALDGEYRAGNLSYMTDSCTIICYLKSDKDEKLPNFPEDVKWNSKKWRVLLYLSENWDMMFAGRQYPFRTDVGINFVKDNLLPQAGLGYWSAWTDKKIKSYDNGVNEFSFQHAYIPYGGNIAPIDEIVMNRKNSLQFNDLLQSSCYEPMYCYKMVESPWSSYFLSLGSEGQPPKKEKIIKYISNMPKIRAGGEVKCLCCGNRNIELTESMMCNECEIEYGQGDSDIFGTCPCCGQRFVFDDGYYVELADEVICPSCADTETAECANCGGLYYKTNMKFDHTTGLYYCKDCYIDCRIGEGDNDRDEGF